MSTAAEPEAALVLAPHPPGALSSSGSGTRNSHYLLDNGRGQPLTIQDLSVTLERQRRKVELEDEVHRELLEAEELEHRIALYKFIGNERRVVTGLGPMRRLLQKWCRIYRAAGVRYSLAKVKLQEREVASRTTIYDEFHSEGYALLLGTAVLLHEAAGRYRLESRIFQDRMLLFRGLVRVNEIKELHQIKFSPEYGYLAKVCVQETSVRNLLHRYRRGFMEEMAARVSLLVLPGKEDEKRRVLAKKEDELFKVMTTRTWHALRYHARRGVEENEYDLRKPVLRQEAVACEVLGAEAFKLKRIVAATQKMLAASARMQMQQKRRAVEDDDREL